jgi:single-strand DNA-binding protein
MNDIIATVLRASVHRFIGRLGCDPELKTFDSGACVARANIAINKPGAKRGDGQQPDWFTVQLWDQAGVEFADQCRQGQLIDVTGRVKSERWTDRNTGEEKMRLVVMAEKWALVDSQAPQQPAPAAAPAVAPAAGVPAPAQHAAYAAAGYQPAPAAAAPPSPVDEDKIPF